MTHRMVMPSIGTAQAWRDAARALIGANVPPSSIIWGDEASAPGLWDAETPSAGRSALKVPRSFITMANTVVWHSDPARFGLLYRVLWRLRDTPHLMSDRADPDLSALRAMEKSVHRCQHKMKAFVRFREVGAPDDSRRSFAAWFEPSHHTVEPTAPFFAGRFGDMDWRIITPDICAAFVDGQISFGPGQAKPPVPDDASEQLWTTYFRSIFNPARLKVRAMQSEMPKKYWKNMPEAAAIPDLIASAPARAREMKLAAPTIPPSRAATVQRQTAPLGSAWSGSPDNLSAGVSACTRCDLHCKATQAVPGEGPRDARLMIVGEQPGDLEDLAGRPFVGPAGRLFDRLAREAGVDRASVYLTNAVKHFKFRPQGRRRIHQRPDRTEIQHCKWWLDAERSVIRPKAILAMGSTAALALTGDGSDLSRRRGVTRVLEDGTTIVLTFHPSYLLRVNDAARRSAATEALLHDLTLSKRCAEAVS